MLRARAVAASAAVAAAVALAPGGVVGQEAPVAPVVSPPASPWAWAAEGPESPFRRAPASGRAGQEAPSPTQDPSSARGDRTRALNTLLSFAVPGTGQLRYGRDRGWAYLALEALAWAGWAERRHRGRELQTRYRDLAWEQARLRSGPRVDPEWAYYETLTKWVRSGGFDVDAAPGLQPEMDPSTYNGSIWALAHSLFLPDGAPMGPSTPGWDRALDYYRRRAWDDRFLWDWSSNPGARQEFTDIIATSDHRFRQATHVLGLVLANHLVSGVDAYLMGGVGRTVSSLRLQPPAAGGRGWLLSGRWEGLP